MSWWIVRRGALSAALLIMAWCAQMGSVSAQDDRDCEDFASQPTAQAYFTERGGSADVNVDNLDRDGDGIACEDLIPGGGEDTDGFPWWTLGVAGGVAIAAGLGVAGYRIVAARRRHATPIAPLPPMPPMPSGMMVSTYVDPDDPFPRFDAVRTAELVAMPIEAYLATPEWAERVAWVTRRSGGRCELCGVNPVVDVRHRTLERRGDEDPKDLIALCGDCSFAMETT